MNKQPFCLPNHVTNHCMVMVEDMLSMNQTAFCLKYFKKIIPMECTCNSKDINYM